MPGRSRGKMTPPAKPVAPPAGPGRGQHQPVEIERIVLAGHRSQGTRFLGRVLATAGMNKGHNVTWLPMFSPTVREATVHCTVLVSREQIGSPLAGVPDVVLALDAGDCELFRPRIKPGGILLYDTGAMEGLAESFRDDIRTIGLPATSMAEELGQPLLAGAVMVGAFAGCSKLLDERSVQEALRRLLETSDPLKLLEADRRAVEEGARYVRERRYMYNRYAYSIFMR